MRNEQDFLITYGLHNFVTHARSEEMHLFTIHGMESQKLIGHARSLISETYGRTAVIQVA